MNGNGHSVKKLQMPAGHYILRRHLVRSAVCLPHYHGPIQPSRIRHRGIIAVALLLALIISFSPASSLAATLNVGPDAAYISIQPAIDAASDGDIIVVADGTYTGDENRNLNYKSKAITVRSLNGPRNCIIDCATTSAGTNSAFRFLTSEGPDSILDGFTITNATTSAILCTKASPTIRNCILDSNHSVYHAGAVFCKDSLATVENCVVKNNSSPTHGGGIYCWDSNVTVRNCAITANTAETGGAIYCYNSTLTLLDSLIAGNHADFIGGGIASRFQNPVTIVNTTFVNNTAEAGPAIHRTNTNLTIVQNCIFWNNEDEDPATDYQIVSDDIGPLFLSFCIVEGAAAAISATSPQNVFYADSNLALDPLLADDYHLSSESPAVDAGDPNTIIADRTDIDSQPRVLRRRIDIGADEAPYAGDVEPDNDIDLADFAAFARSWLETDCSPANDYCRFTDILHDGTVDQRDLMLFLENWPTISDTIP